MSKPKTASIIKPKLVNSTIKNESTLEANLNDHINNTSIHMDTDTRDAITYLRKDIDEHINDSVIHITNEERVTWNAKETPLGAQAKVNKVVSSLKLHEEDINKHITKKEKDFFKDKYTKAETRNLLKHALTGLIFLEPVQNKFELERKYPNPAFNSCIYVKDIKTTIIFNGEKWVPFNALFTPEVTSETAGLMTDQDKIKLDSVENGANNYEHPDNVDTRHVSDTQIDYWNKKADSTLSTILNDGLMSSADKVKLDSVEDGANNYEHPEFHEPSIIKEDETHRFVTDEEKGKWSNKAEISYVDEVGAKTLSASKAFTDTKIAAIFNSSEEQLSVLRSLSFELKKDDTVKQFFDLFNECTKNKEFQSHVLNDKIHMTQSDKILLNDVYEALKSGLNSDWNETNQSSIKYIENKPTALPANGGNADTVGGYRVDKLFTNKNFYDYTIGTPEYTLKDVSVVTTQDTIISKIEEVINFINKGKGYSILFKPGNYTVNKELVIKASNTTISGVGALSKLLGASIRIIGNNNTIEHITLTNLLGGGVINNTAIYVEGNENVIRHNTIMNYVDGIIVEGSDNIIENNSLVNIRNIAVKLTATNNTNYGNKINKNTIKNSNIGIGLYSTKNYLYRNHIVVNNVFNCSTGIILSNTIMDTTKTTSNIINENIVIRGKGNTTDYLSNNKTIVSEFASKNIISSNITSGKEIIASNDLLTNNIF